MKKKIVVPKSSPLATHSSAIVLHEYPNDQILLEIDDAVNTEKKGVKAIFEPGLADVGLNETEETNSDIRLEHLESGTSILAHVSFIGPTDRKWLEQLKNANIEVLRYQPHYTYLCRAKVVDFQKINALNFIEEVNVLNKTQKPAIVVPETGTEEIWILWSDTGETLRSAAMALTELPGVELDPDFDPVKIDHYWRLKANITGEGREQLLQQYQVIGLEKVVTAEVEDEIANLILANEIQTNGQPSGSYLKWLQDHDVNGKDVTIAIVDNGVDTSHEAFDGRITDLAGGKKQWHGTFVAGHAAGNYQKEKDGNGYIYGIGVAPCAEILSIDNSGVVANPTSKSKLAVNNASPSGHSAYIQNNSWGAGTNNPMNYTSLEAAFDKLVRKPDPDTEDYQELVVCFSAGNSGSSGLTRPKAAKNVIVTGNSENYRPNVGNNFSDNIDDVYQNNAHGPSSHGNCGDQRIRPHIVAPGEWTAAAGFGLTSTHPYYISSKLTWGGGTSGASPKTAGACALLVQWWRKHDYGYSPSPAMLRALLVNGAEPMKSNISAPPIPSKIQGWGRLNLANILNDKVHKTYLDQMVVLYNVGDTWTKNLRISDPSQPVKITLTWTDPPGSPNTGHSINSPAMVNSLNLKVEADGNTWQGNNFENGWSKEGGFDNPKLKGIDNTQNVFLKTGEIKDTFKVTVEALNITTSCYDFSNLYPEQDFAIVIHNAYPDTNATPADFFIVVDTGIDNGDDTGDDFYDDDEDYYGDDWDWWDDWYNTGSDDGGDWWDDEDDFDWFGSEANELEEETILVPNVLSEQLLNEIKTAAKVVQSAPVEYQIVPSKEAVTESASNNGLDTIEPVQMPIKLSIKKLMDKWKQLPTDREKKGLIVVGNGSRFDKDAIDGLRKLTFMGQLYLVSDNAAVLQFLAQVINRKQGIHFRLATSTNRLAGHIRDTLTEMAGATIVKVNKSERTNPQDERMYGYSFGMVETDYKCSLQIEFEGDTIPQLALVLPDSKRKPVNIGEYNSRNQRKGITVNQQSGILQVDIDLKNIPQSKVFGKWTVVSSESVKVKTWVWDEKPFRLSLQNPAGVANDDTQKEQRLVVAEAAKGLRFSKINILARAIRPQEEVMAETEALNVLEILPTPKIKMGEEAEVEAIERPLSETLSAWLAYELEEKKATLLDLIIRLDGVDAKGNVFQRAIRQNHIHLQPLSEVLTQQRRQEHLIHALVRKLYYQQGDLRGLRLRSQYGERDFKVKDLQLIQKLEEMDLRAKNLHFGIKGSEIISVLVINS